MNNTTRCIPVNLDFSSGKVKWMDLQDFHDLPFLDSGAIASLDGHTFETGFDELSRRGAERPLLKPSGFIFHTSRCGSTLVSRILQKGGNTLVLVEPQPLNALLVGFTGPQQDPVSSRQWEETGDRMMRELIFAYLNTGFRIIIKFSSFNLLLIRRILRKWEGVPVLFLYRDPIEVVVSNLERNGGFMRKRKAPQLTCMLKQWDTELSDDLTAEEYCVRMVNVYLQVIIDHMQYADNSNTMLKDYASIDIHTIHELIAFFKVELTEKAKSEISGCMDRDAKSGKIFSDDKAVKQAKASRRVYDLCQDLALPNYRVLKDIGVKAC